VHTCSLSLLLVFYTFLDLGDCILYHYFKIQTCNILLIFDTNQGLVQTLSSYPSSGLVTNTILILGALLIFLGIYNSASLVSANDELCKSVYRHASKSRLLELIGKAEREKEIEIIVKRVAINKEILKSNEHIPIQFDENALKKYINFIIEETKKGKL
jgi:hypothetical protein